MKCSTLIGMLCGVSQMPGAVIMPIRTPKDISVPSHTIDFEGVPDTTPATDLYRVQGIRFARDDGFAPKVEVLRTRDDPSSLGFVLTTTSLPAPSYTSHANVIFDPPVYSIGAFFGNDQPFAALDFKFLRLSIYGASGVLLGTTEVVANNNSVADQFIGLSSDAAIFQARFEIFTSTGTPSNVFAVALDDLIFSRVPPSVSKRGRVSNVSLLTSIAPGDDSFTIGYVTGGSGTIGAKPLLVRVAGPALAQFGIRGAADDPKLEIFSRGAKIYENDNWGDAPDLREAMAATGAFSFSTATSRDAAALVTASSVGSSIRVSTAGAGGGTVLAELYDGTPQSVYSDITPRIINVSVLKNIGGGLTLGFVIGGSTPSTVLIRAIGPTIGAAPFDVPNAATDPRIRLHSGATMVAENSGWGGAENLTRAFGQAGAFALPAGSKDAVLLATVEPGQHNVEVSSTTSNNGVVLVEIYEVP